MSPSTTVLFRRCVADGSRKPRLLCSVKCGHFPLEAARCVEMSLLPPFLQHVDVNPIAVAILCFRTAKRSLAHLVFFDTGLAESPEIPTPPYNTAIETVVLNEFQ